MTKDLFDTYANLKFDEKQTKFGGHETFALRYGWLSKGFQALAGNEDFFTEENEKTSAMIDLGVGRGMVKSIKYWLRATQMISHKEYKPTELGLKIFDREAGLDPYLEDEATIWLIHWLLCSNASYATAYFWFFNYYHKPEFTSQELATALDDFVKDKLGVKNVAATTLTKDARLIHRMYTPSKGNTGMPLEDALDSPLASLRLMSQTAGGRSFHSKSEARSSLPVAVVGFALSCLFAKRQEVQTIPIEDLMKSRDGYAALGSIFRLTENELITKLELLANYIPDKFEIRDTAGINQIYQLKSIDPVDYLVKYYQDSQVGEAA